MLRRLLDRLAELAKIEPNWANFSDVPLDDVGDRFPAFGGDE
jgi:hypothetical protein